MQRHTMTIPIIAGAIVCLCVGIAVLARNPRRFPNLAFSFGALVVAAWQMVVFAAVRAEDGAPIGAVDVTIWLRANAMIIASWPWAIWLMKESLVAEVGHARDALRRSLPWIAFTIAEIALCEAPSFVYRDSVGQITRGWTYLAYTVTCGAADILIIASILRELRRQQGIRRVEMQFLALNVGYGGLIGVTVIAIGNVAHMIALKRCGVLLISAPYVVCAWAVTVHRVFDARQLLVSLGQRAALITTMAIMAVILPSLFGRAMPSEIALLLGTALAVAVGLWADKVSRYWLQFDERRSAERMRRAAVSISRSERTTEDLLAAFERMLRTEYDTQFAALISDWNPAHPNLQMRASDRGYDALVQLGWATPESLHRLRHDSAIEDLARFLRLHHLALLLAVPASSRNPSLVVALGPKANRGPFTYPEVEQLVGVSELIDNTLSRSRLTTEAALKSKTEHLALMSRGLARDLRNLITPIDAFLVHTESFVRQDTPEAEVHGAARRSVRIIADYVREALFFAEQLTPEFQHTDIAGVISTAVEVTASKARLRSIRVTPGCSTGIAVIADKVLLQRLLVNLINNAVDASYEGGTVTVETPRVDNRTVLIEVTDTGCGIDHENLKRVFDPYFTTKHYGDAVRGFGLGLTICEKILALHGGRIFVRSEVGLGTTVSVELPRDPTVPHHGAPPEFNRAGRARMKSSWSGAMAAHPRNGSSSPVT